MLYLNTIEQLFLLVEQLDQLEVCLPYSRLLAGIPILAEFQNLRWNSNKTSLINKENISRVAYTNIDPEIKNKTFLKFKKRIISKHKSKFD